MGVRADLKYLEARLKLERTQSARIGLWHGIYLLTRTDALPRLISLLKSRNCAVRSAVARALEDTRFRPSDVEQSRRALREALAHETTAAQESMQTTLNLLERPLQVHQSTMTRNE